jgi:hypothetical protein
MRPEAMVNNGNIRTSRSMRRIASPKPFILSESDKSSIHRPSIANPANRHTIEHIFLIIARIPLLDFRLFSKTLSGWSTGDLVSVL